MDRLAKIALVVATLASGVVTSRADELMRPLAVSGGWIVTAHQPSMLAPPDVCVLFNPESGVALRAENDGLQFRATNKSWSLPVGVQGNIVVTVGEWNTTLEIDDNTDDMVNAELSEAVSTPMFDAMDKGSSMSVKIGKSKQFMVSLTGSTRATNAFKTCAGIKGGTKPGSNPFE
jgi:hypothetical protein